jgi:POT family proton-dependent oligopeptide transporter
LADIAKHLPNDPSGPPHAGRHGAPADHEHDHPQGLYVLFGAEAWERFSYYGMRALLVLYMVNHLKYDRKSALSVYGLYTGLVYLTPIAGGWFADKILGRRKAVLIGGIVMALGHLAMAVESLLYLALGLLIIGNGFFKPNISTIVGGLYREGDPRRDGGFTIFYMGINLGAFFSPLVCGNLGEKLGWHFGFSAAAIGMGFGLAQFILGQRHLGRVGMPVRAEPAPTENPNPYRPDDPGLDAPARLGRRDYADVAVWVAGCCAVVYAILRIGPGLTHLWIHSGLFAKAALFSTLFGVVLVLLYRGSTRQEAQQITVILLLCIFNIFFWMGFEQAGGTMTLFADDQTNRAVNGYGVILIGLAVAAGAWNIWRSTKDQRSGRSLWIGLVALFGLAAAVNVGLGGYLASKGERFVIPASQFQTINPLLIVVLAPSFSRLWEKLDSNPRTRTSTPTKMAIGLILLGLGFVVMFTGSKLAKAGPVSPLWLCAVYAIHTLGELCLSPVGLSMVTKLAPTRVVALAMGLWFLSSSVANVCAGRLEVWLEPYHLPIYGVLVVSSIGPALLLLAVTPLLKKWMHGKA